MSGDGGQALGDIFCGPTYRDIFHQRLRIGTFSNNDMPNHAFIAILTQWQIEGSIGSKWLAILKEAGFEFIRTVSNSVYSGESLLKGKPSDNSPNHIFGLFRNIGAGAITDPFTPPKAWTDLPQVSPEAWNFYYADYSGEKNPMGDVAEDQRAAHTSIWNKIGPAKFMTEKQLVEAGVPITYAGIRSKYPQQLKDQRIAMKKSEEAAKAAPSVAFPSPVKSTIVKGPKIA